MNQIIGNPTAFKVGRRRTVLVSYVSMGEIETCSELSAKRAELECLYYALHRADASVTRRRVRWLVRLHGGLGSKSMQALAVLIILISSPQIGATEETASTPMPAAEQERNLKSVYRLLSRMHGWTPQQISDMSHAQLHTYMSGGADGTGVEKMSGSQYRAFRMQRGMSVN